MALFSFYILLHILSKGGNSILNKHFCLIRKQSGVFGLNNFGEMKGKKTISKYNQVILNWKCELQKVKIDNVIAIIYSIIPITHTHIYIYIQYKKWCHISSFTVHNGNIIFKSMQ